MRDAIRGRGGRGGGGRGGRRGKEEKERGHTGQESEGRLARHSPLPWAAPCVSPSSHLCQTPPIRPPEKAFRTPATAHGICMATIHCMTLLVLASPGSYACHSPTRYPPRPDGTRAQSTRRSPGARIFHNKPSSSSGVTVVAAPSPPPPPRGVFPTRLKINGYVRVMFASVSRTHAHTRLTTHTCTRIHSTHTIHNNIEEHFPLTWTAAIFQYVKTHYSFLQLERTTRSGGIPAP